MRKGVNVHFPSWDHESNLLTINIMVFWVCDMALIVNAICSVSGKKKWKKTCCLPSFIIFLFIVGCIIAGITLLAIFRIDPKHLTVNAVLISIASVVGLAFVLNCRTWWQVLDSLLNSQRKRLHSAASKLHKLKSEGFMKVSTHHLETEVGICCHCPAHWACSWYIKGLYVSCIAVLVFSLFTIRD